jgi:GntR family transcriptional regulator
MSKAADTRPDLGRSAVSYYIQLATLFRRHIETGEWTVGQQIPTVDELSDRFGVARATIRQALGMLEAEGLISRYRAKGTFVNRRPQERIWFDVNTDWNGMFMPRDDIEIEMLSSKLSGPPPCLPHDIGVASAQYRHLRRRHWRKGQAYYLGDIYIEAGIAKQTPESTFKTKTGLHIVADCPGVTIASVRQTLTIGAADVETARYLDLPLSAPVCFLDRSVADDAGRLILIAMGAYRGDVVRLDTSFG